MKISRKQAFQKFHLSNGHISTEISGSGSLSLFIGHFDAGAYKSVIKNAAFESFHIILD